MNTYTKLKQWINNTDDKYFKKALEFFKIYTVFNYFYNSEKGKKEYLRISNYVKNNKIQIKNIQVFKELNKNVSDERTGSIKNYIINEKNNNIRLILNIYQVRCNLFHGAKFLRCPRSEKLIKESIKILKDIVNHKLEDLKGITNE